MTSKGDSLHVEGERCKGGSLAADAMSVKEQSLRVQYTGCRLDWWDMNMLPSIP